MNENAKAEFWYRRAAAHGNVEAMVALSILYGRGNGVLKDQGLAEEFLKQAAEAGDRSSQHSYALHLLNTRPATKNTLEEGEYWVTRASAGGHEESTEILKEIHQQKSQLQEISMKANEGDLISMTRLGELYEAGNKVVPADLGQSRSWYLKAAEQGYRGAQHRLGLSFLNGDDSKESIRVGMAWLEKAASNGEVVAFLDLGRLYYNGDKINKDLSRSLGYFLKAGEQGNGAAQVNIGLQYYQGEGVLKDTAEAAKWFMKAAIAGEPLARSNLVHMHKNKEWTPEGRHKELVLKWAEDGKDK